MSEDSKLSQKSITLVDEDDTSDQVITVNRRPKKSINRIKKTKKTKVSPTEDSEYSEYEKFKEKLFYTSSSRAFSNTYSCSNGDYDSTQDSLSIFTEKKSILNSIIVSSSKCIFI